MALYSDQIALPFRVAFPGAVRNAAYKLVRITGSDPVGGGPMIDVASGGNSQLLIGALRQNVHEVADSVPVIILGEAKVRAGAAITANTMVTADNDGNAIMCTSGSFAIGMAMEAATTQGEIIRAFIQSPPHRITY